MKPPCEVVVKKILPAVRTIVVKDLNERYELNQTQIAEQLGITQPAVSQYLKAARGDRKLKNNLKKTGLLTKLRDLSKEIAENGGQKTQIIGKYCNICELMKKKKTLCKYHIKNEPYLEEENCTLCLSNHNKKR